MAEMHSISTNEDKINKPTKIDINTEIFGTKDGNTFTNNALLYQDILRYGREREYNNEGCRFSDLGNWLIANSLEFSKYYSDSKKRTPLSVRLANNRHRIQKLVDNVVTLGLLKIKSFVEAEKNRREPVELYTFSIEGIFLSWLLKARDEEISGKQSSETIAHISDLVDKCTQASDSYTVLFVNKFFKKCMQKGSFNFIVAFFLSSILPYYTVYTGKDLLLLFLGIRSPLNWILAAPDVFLETLNDLDRRARMVMLFQFKKEIERYHEENYLSEESEISKLNKKISLQVSKQDIRTRLANSGQLAGNHQVSIDENGLSNIVRIPGKEWQMTQIFNIDNYLDVSIPGYCNNCKEHRSIHVDIFAYLNSIIYAHYPGSQALTLSGKCNNCSKDWITVRVMRFAHFVSAWR